MVKMSSHNFFNHHFFQLKHKFNIIRNWSKFHGRCAEYLNEMKKRNAKKNHQQLESLFTSFSLLFAHNYPTTVLTLKPIGSKCHTNVIIY